MKIIGNNIDDKKSHAFINGLSLKLGKNRRVLLAKNTEETCIIQFYNIPENKEHLKTPASINKVLKNKVQLTGIQISNEAAEALFTCLHDYFSRIKK